MRTNPASVTVDIDTLARSCPGLVELDISDSLGISCQSVHSISLLLPHLDCLHLSRCYYVSPDSLRSVFMVTGINYN